MYDWCVWEAPFSRVVLSLSLFQDSRISWEGLLGVGGVEYCWNWFRSNFSLPSHKLVIQSSVRISSTCILNVFTGCIDDS
jgi:hypothetical protein